MSSAVANERPAPVPSPLTEGFWQAAAQGRLAIQRCSKCGHYNHPPTTTCPKCRSHEFEWKDVSGRGTVYEAAVVYGARPEGFAEATPYAVIVVELEEQHGLLVLANLRDAPATIARVGLSVEVVFEEIADGFVLPQFRPALLGSRA